MMMGTLNHSGQSIIKVDQSTWKNFADVQALAISLEPSQPSHQTHPSGKILYQGNLQIMLSNS